MIEVHPPEHPVHGARDFFIHLFTITVGLLIALGLENIAEYAHHRHLVREATANLRHEIEDNRKELDQMLKSVPEEQARFRSLAARFNARAADAAPDDSRINIGMQIVTPQDASWQTANATGALSYMEYARVQRFAAAYQLQKKLDTMQDAATPVVIALLASVTNSDPAKTTKEEAQQDLAQVRSVMANIEAIREIGSDLEKKYDEALKDD